MGQKFFCALLTVCLLAGGVLAEGLQSGFLNPYVTSGVRISPQTITPTMRKWYLPQTLYDIYGWKNWEYTNYARDRYERYTDIVLQGQRFLRYLRQLYHARLENLRVGAAASHGNGQCNRQVRGVQQLVQQLGHFNSVAGSIPHGVDRGRATEDDADADDLFQTAIQRRAMGFPLR